VSIRRRVDLKSLPQAARRDYAVALFQAVRTRLLQRYLQDAGYVHSERWETASCIDRKKASAELQRTCQMGRATVVRGSYWGLRLRVEPENDQYGSIRIIGSDAMPVVEKARGAVIACAGILGFVTGIVAWITGLVQHQPKPVGTGLILGFSVVLAFSLVGLLLILPFARLASMRLRRELQELANLVDQSWADIQKERGFSGSLASIVSPTLKFFAGMILSAMAAGVGYWAQRQSWGAEGAMYFAIWAGIILLGLTSACMGIGFVCYLLDVLD
jgi:hypothetical protein